jgi:putative flippase GtrA
MNPNLVRLLKYGITGVTAAILDFLVFVIGLRLFEAFSVSSMFTVTSSTIANTAGILVGFLWSFILQKYWAFESTGRPFVQFFSVGLLLIINIIITSHLIPIISTDFSIKIEIAKVIMQVMVVVWNFAILNWLIFRK